VRGSAPLQAWVAEMSAFVKGIDSNHLLTIGSEARHPRASQRSAA
jgi:endo-1,4-beta-mannosidase